MKLLNVALAASLLATGPAHAVVTTDGSLGGRQVTLRGNFQIPSDLGKAVDSNLFHSFSTFNLDQGESATFTAPTSIHNIISRVTGGHPSTIDGSIFSTANLYLVNPSGITFGRNAFVDVSGSFHATTADYLRLGSEGRFDATLPANTVLTAAPPSAFGFLGANPKPITVTDSRFSVTGTLGFVGGDITITDGHQIMPPAGFDLVSVASAGEATLTDAAIETSSFSDMGTALFTSSPDNLDDLSVSRGRIFISAGSFILDGATVWGVGDEDITIRARDSVMIRNGSVWGAGKSANLSIVSPSVTVDHGNINLGDVSETGMVGNPGDLTVSATDVEIINGGRVQSFSQRGRGSDINITASGSLTVSGTGLYGEETVPSGIVSSSAQQSAGNITLDAPTITVEKGAEILVRSTGSGAGNLNISSDRLTITDSQIHNSTDYHTAQPTWSGGNISIKTGTFTMSGADLWTSASGSGDGNGAKISIDANIVSLSGDSWILTDSDSERAGEISIRAPKVSVDGAAIVLGRDFKEVTDFSGAAKLTISAGDLEILNGGLIATYSFESRGGDIDINATGAVTVPAEVPAPGGTCHIVP